MSCILCVYLVARAYAPMWMASGRFGWLVAAHHIHNIRNFSQWKRCSRSVLFSLPPFGCYHYNHLHTLTYTFERDRCGRWIAWSTVELICLACIVAELSWVSVAHKAWPIGVMVMLASLHQICIVAVVHDDECIRHKQTPGPHEWERERARNGSMRFNGNSVNKRSVTLEWVTVFWSSSTSSVLLPYATTIVCEASIHSQDIIDTHLQHCNRELCLSSARSFPQTKEKTANVLAS